MRIYSTRYRIIALQIMMTFCINVIGPTIQSAFADSTLYYVDATNGSDNNNGLTPAAPWKTLDHVNVQSFLPGDTINFLCSQTWSGTLMISGQGTSGFPIKYRSYGAGCSSSSLPIMRNIVLSGATYIDLNGLKVSSLTGSSIKVQQSANANIANNIIYMTGEVYNLDVILVSESTGITLSQNTIDPGYNNGITLSGSTNILIDKNSLTSTSTRVGIKIQESSSTVTHNTLNGGNYDIYIKGSGTNIIEKNLFNASWITTNASIYFGPNTTIRNNEFAASNGRSDCWGSTIHCGVIENNSKDYSDGTNYNSEISGNSIGNSMGGNGVYLSGASNVNIQGNTINGIQSTNYASNNIYLKDVSNIGIRNNTLIGSNNTVLQTIQSRVGGISGITFDNNTLYKKNPESPYIELVDLVPGSGTSSLDIGAHGNTFVTLYTPDAPYIRMTKFGGESVTYSKKSQIISQFDTTANVFQSFGYKTYTSTGTLGANLLLNSEFEPELSGWSTYVSTGSQPSNIHTIPGSFSGNSLIFTPRNGIASVQYLRSDTDLGVTDGDIYEVAGYIRATGSGNISIQAFLHPTGNEGTIYSTVPEIIATSTGKIFSTRLRATTTLTTGVQLSLGTTNPLVPIEFDSLTLKKISGITKNTTNNEVLIYTNTGDTNANISCPNNISCGQYADATNTNLGWSGSTIIVPPHSTRLALWNNSPNILYPPSVNLTLSASTIPNGTTAYVNWDISNALEQYLEYTTSSSGKIRNPLGGFSGSLSFIPPSDTTTNVLLSAENDIGPSISQKTLTTINTAPIIAPIILSGSEDSPAITGTLTGSEYNPGDTISYEKISEPTHGNITLSASGDISYTPNPNFCGNDTFSYGAYDQRGQHASPVLATLQIICTNDAPVAVNDSYTITGTLLMLDPLSNDTDPDNLYESQTWTLSGWSLPSHGTIRMINNQFEYTPNIGYIGLDGFTYSFTDQSGAVSNTGTISLTVSPPNTPPTDTSANYTLQEDAQLTGTLSGSDINGNTLTYTASTLPSHGTLTIIGNTFTYSPNANYAGTDSFIYRVSDGTDSSSGARIDITINPVADAPVAGDDTYSLLIDTPFTIPVMINDLDVDSVISSLTFTGYSSPAHGTLSTNGTGFLYTPSIGYSGSDSFTYRLMDETALISSAATVHLTITGSNTPPVASSASVILDEDTQRTTSLSGSDLESSSITFIIDAQPLNGTASLSSTGLLIYTPAKDYFGTDSITYHVSDGIYTSEATPVTYTINPVNDAPTVSSGTYAVTGNNLGGTTHTFTGILIATDVDSSIFSFSASTLPQHGTLILASSGAYSYTPAVGYSGNDSFLYGARDAEGGISNIATITFHVSASNSAPLASSGTFMTNEDTSTIFSLSGSDIDGDMLTYILDTPPSTGALTLTSTGRVTYTPGANMNGTFTFRYHINDGFADSTIETVQIDVLPVNDAPIAGSLSYTGIEGSVIVGSLSGSDIDSSTLTYASVISPTNGNLSLSTGGTMRYTPNTGFTGLDTFSYRIWDGSSYSNIATVTLSISARSSSVVTPINTAGPGGGGGGSSNTSSSVNTHQEPLLSSAPSIPRHLPSQNNALQAAGVRTYMGLSMTGLAAQLFLVNRNLSGSQNFSLLHQEESTPSLSEKNTLYTQIVENPVKYLRKSLWNIIFDAESSDDPISSYEDAIDRVKSIDIDGDLRLTLTKEYALRILEYRMRLYEKIIERDSNISGIRGNSLNVR